MCTNQPVFYVTINGERTYLCGKCISENSSDSDVEILDDNSVTGETCQCEKCK